MQTGEPGAPILVAEGLEDALSLAADWVGTLLGLPGISVLKHLELAAGDVIVFRDGDASGSEADKGLIAGIDALLLAGHSVRVTETPPGEDANALLQSGGPDALRALIDAAKDGELSLNGEVQRLARMDPVDYDQARKAVAQKHDIRVGTLDRMVEEARPKPADEAEPAIVDDPVWDGPLVELAETLDAALVEVSRYIVALETKKTTLILWGAHTHLVHNDLVNLQRSPRLAVQASDAGAGKTTTLEVAAALSFRGIVRSSVTAATILRTLGSTHRTYCLDETDRQLRKGDHDLVAILDCGDRRASAVVERAVPLPNGGWKPEAFNVWGAVAFAGIGELPRTLQDRSVRIFLKKATGKEISEHLRDGSSPELVTIRRQLAAWADAQLSLPDPELPEVLMRQAGRVGDCWRPLIAIADVAGGQWPALARAAALEEVAAEKEQSMTERLLIGIKRAFDGQAKQKPPKDADVDKLPDNPARLRTQTLINMLVADQDEEWNVINHSRPITPYWLRGHLRGLLDPAGAQNWWTGKAKIKSITAATYGCNLRTPGDAICLWLAPFLDLRNYRVYQVDQVYLTASRQKRPIFHTPDVINHRVNLHPMPNQAHLMLMCHRVREKRLISAIKMTLHLIHPIIRRGRKKQTISPERHGLQDPELQPKVEHI